MGYHVHHAIVVASWKKDHIKKAYKIAQDIFIGTNLSELSNEQMNGFTSFCIFPDGSKEGWKESDDGDLERIKFRKILREENMFVDLVEVLFGGDEPELAQVVDTVFYQESEY